VLTGAFFTAEKKWKTLRGPSIDAEIRNVKHAHLIGHFLAIKE
jgi:hypothetical protein